MKFKLKGRKLLNADFKSPDMVVAEFSEDLTDEAMENIVATLNHGEDLFNFLSQFNALTSLPAFKISSFLKGIEIITSQYDYDKWAIKTSRPVDFVE